ncbi:citrate/2-methylcitrate synthase [bacterium]|nr:citrate/2-methylcitrate synthase [bacterium]MBR6462271.1 citrate/2-methylcitrate synthase [bacterium]
MRSEYLVCKLSDEMKNATKIDAELFKRLDVKRGLRNEDGTGVLAGLTNIGDVVGYERDENGNLIPIDGRLYYRGYEVSDLANTAMKEGRFGFEEVAYLLLSGRLPDSEELTSFQNLLRDNMPLEHQTILHIIELEGSNIMNILARSVLEFYTFDKNPDDVSRDNLMRQSIELISKIPATIAYAYNMLRHAEQGKTLHLRHPQDNLSFAENFLYMLKGSDYTPLEARTLDLLLIVHAEHGGGNNSTFTVRVTSSAGTDTYSSIAAGIGSLKGPLHGGANLKVKAMLKYIKENLKDPNDQKALEKILTKILKKEAFDGSGLIYGIGHAVYTLSDPRAELLKKMAAELAKEKGREDEFEFLLRFEKIAAETIYKVKGRKKDLCANVDLYSGFVYDLIGIPQEIYTPLFAMSRIVGWCAHRNEELNFQGRRIIRPAYRCVTDENYYVPLDER